MNGFDRIEAAARRNASRLCVGLDPEPDRIPGGDVVAFLREIIAATRDLVACYKPNLAFFEALGPDDGARALRAVFDATGDIPLIGDAKRGDIGNTSAAYARALFERWGFDAITVNAYGGVDAVEPYLAYADRGIYVWCRSSNPGAADFQDLLVVAPDGHTRPLYEVVAARVLDWNSNGNAGLVAGATYPEQITRLRALCPDLPFLVPGVGAQGGALAEAVRAARRADGGGFVVNASRGVLYAGSGADYTNAARRAAEALRAEMAAALAPAAEETPA